MSLPLPPVDFAMRDELLRRSSGDLPSDLLPSIRAALDDAPVIRDAPMPGPPRARRPRTLTLAAVAGVVVLVAALVALPALRPSTTGKSATAVGSPVSSGRSPMASILPTPVPTQDPIGLTGLRGRPFLVDELITAFLADPAHLEGKIVVVRGPVPSRFQCFVPGKPNASPTSHKCELAVAGGTVAPSGYYAVKVGADGVLTLIGQIQTVDGRPAVAPPALSTQPAGLYLVSGYLRYSARSCQLPLSPPVDNPSCSPAWLTDVSNSVAVYVQPDAYATFVTGPGATGLGPVRGFFLVRLGGGQFAQILARLIPMG